MANESKRFKIEQIDRYEEQILKEEKTITEKTHELGFTAASMVFSISTTASGIYNDTLYLVVLFIGLLNAGISAHSLKYLIASISRKTALQAKLEELKMEENNESRDKVR